MQSEVFIAKYDTYGNPIWAKSLAGTSDDEGNGIALDPSGNPVITGYFLSYPYLIDTINLVNSGLGTGADLFVAKFDTAGNVIWAKTAYGNIHDVVGNAIAMDQNGNALITGYYSGDSAYFDTITLTNGHAVNADIFIVKYDTGGNVIWVNKADGLTNDDIGISITADANGNAYATGYYKSSSIFFDNDTLINSSGGYPDIFIVKLDGQGNTVWAKTAGGSGEDSPFSIAVDANQNVYIAGGFNVNAVSYFDTITLSNPSGYVDLFLVKYDSTGHAQWAMAGGNSATASTVAFAIALSASGDLYITGNFGCDTLTFGNVSLPHTTISNDVFLAKASTGITTSIVQQHHSSNTIAIYPNPGNGNFNIESAGLIDDIKITTVQGQIIYHAKPLDKTVAITLKQEGIYFVTVESNHQTTTSKLVVQE